MAAIEYGNITPDMPMSRAELLDSKPMRLGQSDTLVTLRLERISAGWTCAGSAALHTLEADTAANVVDTLRARVQAGQKANFLRDSAPLPLGISRPEWEARLNPLVTAGQRASRALAEVERREREARRAEQLEAWRAGETNTLPLPDSRTPVYLRAVDVKRDESGAITGGELQTSHGARVPLVHAVRAFRFIKMVRERTQAQFIPPDTAALTVAWEANGQRVRVGSFAINAIYGDGAFKAGCHFVKWPQVRECAEALGVYDLVASDEAARETA